MPPRKNVVSFSQGEGKDPMVFDLGPWVVIYPCYINKELPYSKGRKLPKSQGTPRKLTRSDARPLVSLSTPLLARPR